MPLHWVDLDVTGHNRWDEVVTNFLVIIGISLENLKKCLKKSKWDTFSFWRCICFFILFYFIFSPLYGYFFFMIVTIFKLRWEEVHQRRPLSHSTTIINWLMLRTFLYCSLWKLLLNIWNETSNRCELVQYNRKCCPEMQISITIQFDVKSVNAVTVVAILA